MKRVLILLIVFVFTIETNSNNNVFNEITIPKIFKIEKTFSGDISDTNSFHLIFTKNKKTKDYVVFTYVYDGSKIIELPDFITSKHATILSYHNKNGILTLLVSNRLRKKSFLTKVDYDLVSNKVTKSMSLNHVNFEKVLREKERSVLIYKSDDFLTVKSFIGNADADVKILTINKLDVINDYFRDNYIGAVKTDEFIKNGSTTRFKLYLHRNELIFTKDTKLFANTEVIKLNLDADKLFVKESSFDNDLNEETIQIGSFYSNQLLYQFILKSEKSYISIFNTETGAKIKTIAIDNSLDSYVRNENFKGIQDFLKMAKRPEHIVTIAVNNAIDKKIILRLDYVDINYTYNNNFWMQQQMMRSLNNNLMQIKVPIGFGPSPFDYDSSYAYSVAKNNRFFEIVVDKKGNLFNENLPETIYNEINKSKYLDKLKGNLNFKYKSNCFLSNSFRYIVFDKASKKFIIKNDVL